MLQDIPVISRVKDISTEAKTSLYLMDVERLLDALPVEPLFDLVVTSPPYNIGKEYENQMPLDEYVAWQKRILEKIYLRLKPSGSICWQVGNYVDNGSIVPLDFEFAPIFKQLGMQLRNRIIWRFGHGLHSKKRFSGRYEVVLWYTKTDDYVFNLDDVRIPAKYPGKRSFKGPNKGQLSGNPLGKNPEDVWDIPNVKGNHVEKTIHPCQFPVGLIERLVLALTNEGELVFDPFCGVASTGVAALLHKRNFWGCEVIKEYIEMGRERLNATVAGTVDRLLVVAPKNAFGAWEEQLAECVPSEKQSFVRLRGGEQSIELKLRDNPKYMLITYQQYPRVKNLIQKLLQNHPTFMFLDESHRIKSGKIGVSAEAILEISYLPKRKLIMSGTPMPQSQKDLIPQLNFLYPEKKVTEEDAIEALQPVYVRTTKGQLGIPEVEHRLITLPMDALQEQIYRTLKSEVKRNLIPVISDASKYSLREIGKRTMKVMQFVSNPALLARDMEFAFDERMGKLLSQNNGPKIEYACGRARQLAAEGKKVIIWSTFVENVELIATRLADLGADYIHGGVDAGDEEDNDTREWKIKEFHNNPNKWVLVANPAAASEGISLHKVCQNAIYIDRSFNAAQYLQSEDRIHRLKSVCCTDEWGAFYGKALHDKSCVIYPIIIDDSAPPALISQIKYLRLNGDEYASALSTLLISLRKQFSK